MKNRFSYLFLLCIMMLFSSYANASVLFEVPETDWVNKNIMIPLFDPEQSPFGSISAVFLGGVLMIGGVLAAYTIIHGTVATAHDGEVLGNRWSAVWIPLRTGFGLAMILPIKNGFCAIQMIVVWLATQGIGFADLAYSSWIDSGGITNSAVSIQPASKSLSREIWSSATKNATCLYSIQELVNKYTAQGSPVAKLFTNLNLGYHQSTIGNTYRYDLGIGNASVVEGSISICGSLKLDTISQGTLSKVNNFYQLQINDSIVDMNKVSMIVDDINKEQFKQLISSTQAMGAKIAAGTATADDVNNAFNSYYSSYVALVNSKKSVMSEVVNPNVTEAMKQDGFISLGVWSYRIAKAQNDINTAINNGPKAMENGNDLTGLVLSYFSDTVKGGMNRAANLLDAADRKFNTGVESNGISSTGNKLLNSLINALTPESLRPDTDTIMDNPMVMVPHFGFVFLGIAQTLLTVLLGFSVAAFVPGGSGTGVVAAILAASPFLLMIVPTLVMGGLYAAIYVPMLIFIQMVGALLGWVTMVFEALFASVIWMVAHMSPDADGFVGKQGQGYLLVLSLILRPVFIVIGVIGAISIIKPFSYLIGYFWSALTTNMASGFSFVLVTYGLLIIYFMLMKNMMIKVLSLTHSLGDGILTWIAGRADTVMGQYAQGIEGDSKRDIGQFNNTMSNTANSAGRTWNSSVSKLRQNLANSKNNSGVAKKSN
ncbi:DotA/TraY family protein [Leclercia adecarboxylata]|uniref:DotA/TraY family protein n=1 Tax=Leclercia adecarboxylata TaxID=83655 RepID=UPI00301639E3